MKRTLAAILILLSLTARAQDDSTDIITLSKVTELSEVVIRSDLNVVEFLRRIKNDTTFYKAFKNLRVLGFTSLNDIHMTDKKGRSSATLQSKTKQVRRNGCRTMQVLEEKHTGDMYKGGNLNYYTAELYASLFFTKGEICGEDNIVSGVERKVRETKGIEKHKEQLKMLFFNPGKKIPGIPFIGNKIDIFDPEVSRLYDFSIDIDNVNGQDCYVFRINPREDLTSSQKKDIVFDNITTWFNTKTMEIVARNYDLSFSTPAYDFDVHMEVQMMKFGSYLVPRVLRYNGNWDVAFKKRERGVFTATLFDFVAD
jgi:hypothetical protein